MKSVLLYTEEMDDVGLGVTELGEDLTQKNFSLEQNTVGVCFFHSDTDATELVRELGARFSFPIIGASAAALLTDLGYRSQGISLLVLTADDVEFTTHTVADLGNLDEVREKITADTEFIFGLISMNYGESGDKYKRALAEISGDISHYAAVSSDDFTISKTKIFNQGEILASGIVLLAISGNVSPLVISEYFSKKETSFSAIVTESKGNVVYRLGKATFLDAIEEAGLIFSDQSDAFMEAIGLSFIFNYITDDGDEIILPRHLLSVDYATCSGRFLGDVPEGAKLNIYLAERTDVKTTVKAILDKSFKEYNQRKHKQYTASTALVFSGVARAMIFSSDIKEQSKGHLEMMPSFVTASGFYTYGEVAEVKGDLTEKQSSEYLNSSFSVLVL